MVAKVSSTRVLARGVLRFSSFLRFSFFLVSQYSFVQEKSNMATTSDSDPSVVEKALAAEKEEVIDGLGINHDAWDNHASLNNLPTHEPGYENKV